MTQATLYQDFVSPPESGRSGETEESEIRLARARGKARAAGFAEGVANAEASFDHDMKQRIEAISTALATLTTAKITEDRAALDATRRIVEQALRAFAPRLADAALPALVADVVSHALLQDLEGSICIEVSPGRLTELRDHLAIEDVRVSISDAQDLGTSSARILWRGGFDQIDTDTAIEAGLTMLDERLRAAASQPKPKDTQK